jgi:Protein of unknown function (DUF3443)
MSAQDGFTRVSGSRLCLVVLIAGPIALSACGGSGSSSSSGGLQVNNIQPVQVNFGPAGNDEDTLFASITVCMPGSTVNCQTIQDVQVDTGSSGLRILASQITISLPQVTDSSGNPIGNCVTFADNSFVWGPVRTADVQMAGEKASSVPIQIIDEPSFSAVPTACNSGGTNDNTAMALGSNGILGVGLFRQDCGAGCTSSATQIPNIYFSCPSSGCSATAVPLQQQLQNPVWLFPQDNNGVLISLPSVPAQGSASVDGSLIFGIGTQSNNALGTAKVYTTDNQGNFSTTYNGSTYSASSLDTGSNGIFFLDSTTVGIPTCTGGNSHFYCPSSTVSFTAINAGTDGASGQVSFSIANADTLFSTINSAFNDVGGPNAGSFDWGLPFFLGRNVFTAIESQSTPAGAGPYWAY